MRKINEAMTKTAVPGSYIVDTLPFLNYLPRFLAPWKVEADEIFEDTLRLFSKHVNKVRNDLSEGRDSPCFAKSILQSQKEYQLTDNQSVFMAGAMYVSLQPVQSQIRVTHGYAWLRELDQTL